MISSIELYAQAFHGRLLFDLVLLQMNAASMPMRVVVGPVQGVLIIISDALTQVEIVKGE